jgi:DNA-binding transcriptional regulator YdaS (Cro superfamily)
MDLLIAYINALSAEQRVAFEAATGTTIAYLRKAASSRQRLGETICIDIERATGGQVTCEALRPDLSDRWAYLRNTKPVVDKIITTTAAQFGIQRKEVSA